MASRASEAPRVLVTTVLDSLALGDTAAELMADYPSLTTEGIRGPLAYGSWIARQKVHRLAPSGF